MKTFLMYLLCAFLAFNCLAQEKSKTTKNREVTPPEFIGITDVENAAENNQEISIADFLSQNLQYPEEAIKTCCEGTEVIRFDVTPFGQLTNFTIVNSVSPAIDAAVISLLKSTQGMWKPGLKNGEPVTMGKEVKIAYKWGEFECFAKCKDFKELAGIYLQKGNKQLLDKHNPERALKLYNKGIKYLPDEDCLLLSRGMARFELGDKEGAQHDWDRMKLAGINKESEILTENLKKLKGYKELAETLNNNQ